MAKRVDANQPDIVDTLRKAGVQVAITSDLGKGFPDIVVSWAPSVAWILAQPHPLRICLPIEIKAGKAGLTPDEVNWHRDWIGPVAIVRSPVEALEALGLVAAPVSRLEAHAAQLRRR